jgi:hypothetical protein
VFDNRMLSNVFGPKRDGVAGGGGENYIMRRSLICASHQILCGWSNRKELDGLGM